MKANRLIVLLLTVAVTIQLPAQQIAQQIELERRIKDFNDTKAKAEKGEAEAQTTLGIFYFSGWCVSKDTSVAVKWWRKAADQNSANAQYFLGDCYASGLGVTKDEPEAVKWYHKAADQDLAQAQDSGAFLNQ
jgi:TPR repeat protein